MKRWIVQLILQLLLERSRASLSGAIPFSRLCCGSTDLRRDSHAHGCEEQPLFASKTVLSVGMPLMGGVISVLGRAPKATDHDMVTVGEMSGLVERCLNDSS